MEMHRRVNAVKRFIESPASTKTGIENYYSKRTDTLNKRLKKEYGISSGFSWEDLANYYESDISDLMASLYGSETIVIALAKIQDIADDEEKIQLVKNGKLKIGIDEASDKVIQDMLNRGLNPQEVFGKAVKQKAKVKTKKQKRNVGKSGRGRKKRKSKKRK